MMKSFTLAVAVSVIALATPAFAATPDPVKVPDTLMFTIDELNEIQSRISGSAVEHKEDTAIENATLYLSSIIYSGPKDWTIWLNGKPIKSGDEFQAFKVMDITPSSVQLLVPLSAQGMTPVRLGPNQTFVARSGVVIEGRAK